MCSHRHCSAKQHSCIDQAISHNFPKPWPRPPQAAGPSTSTTLWWSILEYDGEKYLAANLLDAFARTLPDATTALVMSLYSTSTSVFLYLLTASAMKPLRPVSYPRVVVKIPYLVPVHGQESCWSAASQSWLCR